MKRILAAALSCVLLAGSAVGFAACTNEDDQLRDAADVTITFWNPITGPDAKYMQDLVSQFNTANEGSIYVEADAQAEANHYQRILTSFTDNSTADLCLIHKSRIPSYQRQGKLRDMTQLLADQGIVSEDYVGDNWQACEIDGKMYAAPFDVLPTVLFYNRKLIPDGYTEQDILSDDFTLDQMIEMMKAAYVDSPVSSRKVYGMSFNYSYTEPMFLSFLNQQGEAAVSADAPTQPTFATQAGYAAAEGVRKMPLATTDGGQKVCSESGADHLNIFAQGRALFTIDGIWSAPDACEKSDKVDAGVALLPKLNDTVQSRKVAGDGHCFAMFTNGNSSAERDAAIAKFMKYLIDNSGVWCQGGKVAARSDIAEDASYQTLEWAYLSDALTEIVSPVKVYTYDTVTEPIGKYVARLCEEAIKGETTTDVKKAIDDAANEARQAAEAL